MSENRAGFRFGRLVVGPNSISTFSGFRLRFIMFRSSLPWKQRHSFLSLNIQGTSFGRYVFDHVHRGRTKEEQGKGEVNQRSPFGKTGFPRSNTRASERQRENSRMPGLESGARGVRRATASSQTPAVHLSGPTAAALSPPSPVRPPSRPRASERDTERVPGRKRESRGTVPHEQDRPRQRPWEDEGKTTAPPYARGFAPEGGVEREADKGREWERTKEKRRERDLKSLHHWTVLSWSS